MEFAILERLTLNTVDKNNKDDISFVKRLFCDKSIKKWFSGMSVGLLSNPNNEFFGHGFLVKDRVKYVGYIGIGNYNVDERAVYLRSAIDKDLRGMGYGEILLNEITEYIFFNYTGVESIRLKIASNNVASLRTAKKCQYELLRDDFYIRYNPYVRKVKTKLKDEC